MTSIKHGHQLGRKSPTYVTWDGMIQRTTNPNSTRYHDYGGRGVRVCDRWRTFENFLTDMGERPTGKTLDRIDNNGIYEPGNCRWATISEQNFNRAPRLIGYGDQQKTLGEWAKHLGVSKPAICRRLAKGWPIERALSAKKYQRGFKPVSLEELVSEMRDG